ncbi:hypothetical protein [Anaerococcus nagyae]
MNLISKYTEGMRIAKENIIGFVIVVFAIASDDRILIRINAIVI